MNTFQVTIDPTASNLSIHEQIENAISALPEIEDGEVWVQDGITILRFEGEKTNTEYVHHVYVRLWIDMCKQTNRKPKKTIQYNKDKAGNHALITKETER